MASGSFEKATRQYTKALDLDPGNAILYSNRSAAHFNLRQFAESLEDAESAILCDAMWWKAYKRKGLSLIHMQRYEEAITALEDGLKIVKSNAEMEKNLEFARACKDQAQNLYILPEPKMMERLESVPVFIVTDEVGQPFFITYDDGQQVCTFYFDKADATATLDWINSENEDLGDTARVIHITLNQAFNLAQETQKQHYEEATRAAVEEDKRNAAAGSDVDGDEAEEAPSQEKTEEEKKEASAAVDIVVDLTADDGGTAEKDGVKDDGVTKDGGDSIDENAPLSFQFRPELRQVETAVEYLNKHPNPAIKPILRDPMSVNKAEKMTDAAAVESKKEDEELKDEKVSTSPSLPEKNSNVDADAKTVTAEAKSKDDGESAEKDATAADDDIELTVDNFNGIPIFQAKGLTLIQNNKQLLPLFFAKEDVEAAWKQLANAQAGKVPSACEIEVGTLEDVLRRISECKTNEFDNVFFVPSRSAMESIGARFPLDDLTPPQAPSVTGARKATFSKAKQVAANGGSRDEVRAAVREDVERAVERQRMAEIIAQIELARRRSQAAGFVDSSRRSGHVDRTMRRNAQRMQRKRAAKNATRQQLVQPARRGASLAGAGATGSAPPATPVNID